MILNISPKADGSIPEEQKEILLALGDWLKKYGEAMSIYLKGYALDPDYWAMKNILGRIYLKQGMYEKAIEIFKPLDQSSAKSHLLFCLIKIGKLDEAEKLLNILANGSSNSIIHAFFYAATNEADLMFECLEKLYQTHTFTLVFIKSDIPFDNYRTEPRYIALMKKMNLPID